MRDIGEAEAVVVDGEAQVEAEAEAGRVGRNGAHRLVNTTQWDGESISGHERRR